MTGAVIEQLRWKSCWRRERRQLFSSSFPPFSSYSVGGDGWRGGKERRNEEKSSFSHRAGAAFSFVFFFPMQIRQQPRKKKRRFWRGERESQSPVLGTKLGSLSKQQAAISHRDLWCVFGKHCFFFFLFFSPHISSSLSDTISTKLFW